MSPGHSECPRAAPPCLLTAQTRRVSSQAPWLPSRLCVPGADAPKEGAVIGVPYKSGTRAWPSSVFTCLRLPTAAGPGGSQRRTQARQGGRGRRRGRRLFKLAVRAGPPRPGQRGPLSARRGRAAPGTAPLSRGPGGSLRHGGRRGPAAGCEGAPPCPAGGAGQRRRLPPASARLPPAMAARGAERRGAERRGSAGVWPLPGSAP